MYKIPTFLSVGSFFEEGVGVLKKFWPEAEILEIISIETPLTEQNCFKKAIYIDQCSNKCLFWTESNIEYNLCCEIYSISAR